MAEKKEKTIKEILDIKDLKSDERVIYTVPMDNLNPKEKTMLVVYNLQEYAVKRGVPVDMPKTIAKIISNRIKLETEIDTPIEHSKDGTRVF